MDLLRVFLGLALPWVLGTGLVLALEPRGLDRNGSMAWGVGTGYLLGAFVVTLWIRLLSAVGVPFGFAAVVAPVAVSAAVVGVWSGRRFVRDAFRSRTTLEGAARVLWWTVIAWLALRFVLLGIEIELRPLYPWDAWMQWATKAHVWYALRHMVPFVFADQWLASSGAVFFDGAPHYPPTVPLLQVWSSVLLGRWDDALMNWPWWAIAVALAFAVYGGTRRLGVGPATALASAGLVATLPLLDVHVALAGYADLPMAAYYTVAALAFLHWSRSRHWRDATLALVFAIACTQIKQPGIVWAGTLLAGIVPVLWPRHALRITGAGLGVAFLVILVLAQTSPVIMNYRLHLELDVAWDVLAATYLLYGNWHLLFYGFIAIVLIARRHLIGSTLAPATAIVTAGVFFLGVVFAFTNARAWVADQSTVNRATLHLAPLMVVFMVLAFDEFAKAWSRRSATEAGRLAVQPSA